MATGHTGQPQTRVIKQFAYIDVMDVARIIKENALLRGLSKQTIKTYTVTVEKFLRTYRLAPHQVTQNHIKTFLLRKLESGSSGNTINVYLNALKFFYETCLNKKLTINIKYSKAPKKLPEFLTKEGGIRRYESHAYFF